MSNPSSHSGGHIPGTPVPHAAHEDGMNIAKIVVVGVVSLIIFAVSAVVAALILSADEKTMKAAGIAPMPADIAKKEEIGIIDYVPFDSDRRLEHWRAQKQQQLSGYGWVDRQKGTIHIPIDQAMKDVIRQSAGSGGSNNK